MPRRTLVVALLALALAAVLAAPAWGAKVLYPSQTGQFGSDGTDATPLTGGGMLTVNQSSHRLYGLGYLEGPKIFGFDISTPGTHAPLGAGDGFPIDITSPGLPGLSTDGAPGGTGNIFYVTESGSILYGYSSTGVDSLRVPGQRPGRCLRRRDRR